MDLRLVEHVSGVWKYHLADYDAPATGLRVALCGLEDMMDVGSGKANLHLRGHVGHLRERYCSTCAAQAAARGVKLPVR